MFFSCEKLVLQSAVNTAARAVPSKSSIPALEGLLLTCRDQYLSITGYNTQIGIRTQIPCQDTQDGQMVLNARLLGDIIRRLPNDTISLSTEANSDGNQMAHIKCADASFHIAGIPADDYPELPEVEENESVQLPEQLLRQMIQQTSFAISTNEARPVHMGSLFEIIGDTLTIVSVDGFRLAMRREPIQTVGKSFSFVAPGTALNEMERICTDTDAPVNITVGERHILFEAGNNELICRRLEGEFLDYKNAIPRKNPIKLTVDTAMMIESLERVSVVISEKLKSPVRCLFGEDRVEFFAQTANGGARDVCHLTGNGKNLEIGFNNRYLIEALRYAPADTVRLDLNTSISPAIITPITDDDRFLYMVLPVRLKASQ